MPHGHRELCPLGQDFDLPMRVEWDELSTCLCPLIDAVTALVRERVAAQIRDESRRYPGNDPWSIGYESGCLVAAHIARRGGSDG